MSGGFSVHDDHIYTLSDSINEAYRKLGDESLYEEELLVDATLSLSHINQILIKTLAKLAPFGMGNAKPIFRFEKITPSKVLTFGKGSEHLKLLFETDEKSHEAIAFFSAVDSFARTPKEGIPLNLLAHVEESFFMGRRQVRMRIVDIVE
jgi:single-stranded-DNA-specific exonuclease